jgi:DNA-binding HxlR family transcriptional regulator
VVGGGRQTGGVKVLKGRQVPGRRDPSPIMRPGVRLVVNLLGDKWTVPVVHLLAPGPRRHAELKRGLPGVSQRMLTRTLRRLEARGLLSRTVHGTVPPGVEYALTPLGRSLNRSLDTLCHWTERHADEIRGETLGS